MNRRKFLTSLPVIALAPTLLGSKPTEHSGQIYWNEEEYNEMFNLEDNVIAFWHRYWLDPNSHSFYNYILYADSVTCNFALEARWGEAEFWKRVKYFQGKPIRQVIRIEGNKEVMLDVAKNEFKLSPKSCELLERAIDNFIERYTNKIKQK